MTLKQNLAGAGLVVALSLGVVAVPTTAHASERTVSVVAAETSAQGSTRQLGATAPAPAPAPAAPASSPEADERGVGSIFIKAVKKYGASAYKAMVKSVKSGYSAYKRWFNALPGWVKAASGGITVDALYDLIKSALGL